MSDLSAITAPPGISSDHPSEICRKGVIGLKNMDSPGWGFCNGEPLDCSQYASLQDFLLAFEKGAYTGLMVQNGQLENWDLHVERLKR